MPVGELSTTGLVQKALADGKEVYIPYLHTINSVSASPYSSLAASSSQQTPSSVMEMLALRSFDEFQSLGRDRWGIPSLNQDQALDRKNCLGGYGPMRRLTSTTTFEITAEDEHRHHGVDLLIMPGMAFDHGFRRLGHGKGYYDDFLARYQSMNSERSEMPFLGKKSSPSRLQQLLDFNTPPAPTPFQPPSVSKSSCFLQQKRSPLPNTTGQ